MYANRPLRTQKNAHIYFHFFEYCKSLHKQRKNEQCNENSNLNGVFIMTLLF